MCPKLISTSVFFLTFPSSHPTLSKNARTNIYPKCRDNSILSFSFFYMNVVWQKYAYSFFQIYFIYIYVCVCVCVCICYT